MAQSDSDETKSGASTERFDRLIIDEIRAAGERVRSLAESERGLPEREVPGLRRTSRGLEAITREVIDWKLVTLVIGGTPGFWPRMAELTETLSLDPAVEAQIGFTSDAEQRALALWNHVIAPLVEQYGRRCSDLCWDEDLAADLVAQWRLLQAPNPIPHQTVAPLHNLRGINARVEIDAGTVIRRLTDDDRDELWRGFGGRAAGIPGLSPGQLDAWTDAIDVRWKMPREPPLSDEIAIQRVADVVTALRLHHPGVTGTTILWTRLDPPDAPVGASWAGQSLFGPHGAPQFMHPLRTDLGPGDGAALRRLLERLAAARDDRRTALALRRFDSAYERHAPEDALIDLWVAFEALLVPDGTAELSYRASLRIARLAGNTRSEREQAFRLARSSYDLRSKVVHGSQPPANLGKVLEDTRHLARTVLRSWILNPPSGDVSDLDRAALS